jgi:hypothetical protein
MERWEMHWTERELGLNPESELAKELDRKTREIGKRLNEATDSEAQGCAAATGQPVMTAKREAKIRELLEREVPCPACSGRGTQHVLDGDNLREIRLEKGVEAKKLAGDAGISAPFLCQIELSRRKLSVAVADRLLRALGI